MTITRTKQLKQNSSEDTPVAQNLGGAAAPLAPPARTPMVVNV